MNDLEPVQSHNTNTRTWLCEWIELGEYRSVILTDDDLGMFADRIATHPWTTDTLLTLL